MNDLYSLQASFFFFSLVGGVLCKHFYVTDPLKGILFSPSCGGDSIENEAYNYDGLSHAQCNACNWRISYGIESQQY